jgi:hypothetical protein
MLLDCSTWFGGMVPSELGFPSDVDAVRLMAGAAFACDAIWNGGSAIVSIRAFVRTILVKI